MTNQDTEALKALQDKVLDKLNDMEYHETIDILNIDLDSVIQAHLQGLSIAELLELL